MQSKSLTLLQNLTIEEKDFQDLNNAEIMKANLLKKITLNTLIIMNIEEKRNLGLKSTDFVKIILKPDPDNKQNYIGIGEIFKDSNKDKSENIKLIIVSMN